MAERSSDPRQELSLSLGSRRGELARAITDRHYELQPDLAVRYGAAGRAKCLQDADFHLSYLADAVSVDLPALFADYVAWAKVMLAGRGIPQEDLARNLEVMREVLLRELPPDQGLIAVEHIEAGLRQIPEMAAEIPSQIRDDEPLAEMARAYLQALLRGERHVASRLVLEAVESGTSVRDVYLYVFQRAQHEVGCLWQSNRLSVAQEHYCTAATQLIMSQLYPYLFAGRRTGHTLVATCVAGDLHEIGVRMVSDFFEMDGWDTFYLGANTPTVSLLRTIEERGADLLAVSATMTFHLRAVKELISAVRGTPSGERLKILVGGYPFNLSPDLWRIVGADAWGRDALESVTVADRLLRQEPWK
jgi:methanogenic corrinoid protein MtbC1